MGNASSISAAAIPKAAGAKSYITVLKKQDLMHESGGQSIAVAKANGSWAQLDDVENGIIPNDLQKAFDENPKAFKNYQDFTQGQRKSYLYWLNQAKREATRKKRIGEIVSFCEAGIKARG